MADFMNPSNITVEDGSMVPTVDGDLIKEDLAYPKSWDSEVYNSFEALILCQELWMVKGTWGCLSFTLVLLRK